MAEQRAVSGTVGAARTRKSVEYTLGLWRGADEYVKTDRMPAARRRAYDQAIGEVTTALGGVQSLELLVAQYEMRWKEEGSDDTTQAVEQALKRHTSKKESLERNLVEKAGYYRRATKLLATWWTHDWEQSRYTTQVSQDSTATASELSTQRRISATKARQHDEQKTSRSRNKSRERPKPKLVQGD